MSAVLDRVDAEVAQLRTDAGQSYELLVASIAEGEDIDVGTVLTVCDAAGRTPEQLRTAVERLTERRRLAGELARGDADAERRAAVEDLEQLERQRTEVLKDLDRRIRAARERSEASLRGVTAAKAARRRLIETAAPELVERHRMTEERAAAAATRVDQLRRKIDDVNKDATRPLPPKPTWDDRLMRDKSIEPNAREREEIEKAQQEVERLRGELVEAEAEAALLRTQTAAAFAALLVV